MAAFLVKKADIMAAFANGDLDILVATTVIEVVWTFPTPA